MQLQAALQDFLVQLVADGRSEHTRKQYQRHVRAFIAWLKAEKRSTAINRITTHTIAEFFASEAATTSARGGTKRATSLNAQRTSLRCLFRWARDVGIAKANAARLLRRARCSAPPPRPLHDDEQRRLLKMLDKAEGPEAERDRMLIHLLLGAGIRIGSAVALDIDDVDFAHGEIRLRTTKNDRPATVFLPKPLAKRLKAFVAERLGPVFLARRRRISVRHAQRRTSQWLAAASIRGATAHSLRHSYATDLLARTGDLRLVQVALNHASIISTTIYAAADRTRLRSAVQA